MQRYTTITAALAACPVAIALTHSTAFGGAWVQKKDGYFFKLTGGYLYTTEEYDSAGSIQRIRRGDDGISNTSYKEISFTGYLEYGLTDGMTLVANLPLKINTSGRTEAATVFGPERDVEVVTGGLSDLTLSVRLHLAGRATPLSIQAGVKLPLGYDPSPPDEGAPLGSGKVDVEGLVLAGVGLWPIRAYLTGQIGYRVRGGTGIVDEYLFQLEGGFTPGRWLAKATLEGVYSAQPPGNQESSTVIVTNMDVLKIIPTVAYRIGPRTAVGVEVFHTLSGRNTVAGTTYAVGIVFSN
jgi:hypothetical protein